MAWLSFWSFVIVLEYAKSKGQKKKKKLKIKKGEKRRVAECQPWQREIPLPARMMASSHKKLTLDWMTVRNWCGANLDFNFYMRTEPSTTTTSHSVFFFFPTHTLFFSLSDLIAP